MLDKIVLRQMTIEDAVVAAQIEKECFSLPWSEEAIIASLKQSYSYFVVAEASGCVVGYGSVYVVVGEAEIINIAVKKDYRGHGIGRGLVMSLLKEAKNRNAENVILEVRESNVAAISLYEKCGFEKTGIRKNFYERPVEDAVIMWKNVQ